MVDYWTQTRIKEPLGDVFSFERAAHKAQEDFDRAKSLLEEFRKLERNEKI